MKLREIAHSRTGDKGEISNISVIPYKESDYEYLKDVLTAEKVKDYFHEICKGDVVRYELPGIKSLNFVLDKTLGGGVTRSLSLDKHGKSLCMALLEMELDDTNYKENNTVIETEEISIADLFQDKRTIRIGSGAGYAGDRIDPAIELLEKGELDYIIFECLAERTIALGQIEKSKNPNLGYNHLLEERMTQVLPLAAKNHVKVITNMGSVNPKAAALKTEEIAKSIGCEQLNIAYVTGDDMFSNLQAYNDHTILENGAKLCDFHKEFVSANAYMGAEGIVRALNEGADIVITGRVSDPALTIAPLVYEFGWEVSQNPEEMGQAVLAGHLLECAGQVTGGYYCDPGFKDVAHLERLGFPIIEIAENGEFVVTKVAESGGLVTPDTLKEQTIYEIHNPKRYMTPDAIADFSNVIYQQIGKDQVLAKGATSHGKPETLKVNIGYRDCFIGEGEISYGGANCYERACLAADIIEKRLPILGISPDEFRIEYIGYNSLYRNEISNMLCQNDGPVNPSEIRLRVSARFSDKVSAQKLANDVEALYTNGPAGGGGATTKVTEVLSVCSIFIPRTDVTAKHHFLGDLPFPAKGVLTSFPPIGNAIREGCPKLADPSVVASLPEDLGLFGLKAFLNLSDEENDKLLSSVNKANKAFGELVAREEAEFGVPVDSSEPCHQWSNHDVEVQRECVAHIVRKYKGRKGEIIFYGPSNIQMWYSLEKDMLPYAAQNHGMGGCVDSEMITYAKEMLYDFEPSVVFFQTGSNDLAIGLTIEEILENKKRMYTEFLANMPNTKLVVMSGLPLPGRQVFWEDTVKTNKMLQCMCEATDRMYFMDASDVLTRNYGTENMKTYDGRYFIPEYYRADGIHLNKAGHDVWTKRMKEMIASILD